MGKMHKKKKVRKNNNYKTQKPAVKKSKAKAVKKDKRNRPAGYGWIMLLGIVVLLLPVALYLAFVIPCGVNSAWIMLGWVGAFGIGIALFNLVAIMVKQYLGWWVSVVSAVVGGAMIVFSLWQMGIL